MWEGSRKLVQPARDTNCEDTLKAAQSDANFSPFHFLWDASASLQKALWHSKRHGTVLTSVSVCCKLLIPSGRLRYCTFKILPKLPPSTHHSLTAYIQSVQLIDPWCISVLEHCSGYVQARDSLRASCPVHQQCANRTFHTFHGKARLAHLCCIWMRKNTVSYTYYSWVY